MSFPVITQVVEEAPLPPKQPEQKQEPNGVPAALPLRPADGRKTCSACDGTGFWRGIDGYTFTCQECTFEMT